jgi:hypothetical protein
VVFKILPALYEYVLMAPAQRPIDFMRIYGGFMKAAFFASLLISALIVGVLYVKRLNSARTGITKSMQQSGLNVQEPKTANEIPGAVKNALDQMTDQRSRSIQNAE